MNFFNSIINYIKTPMGLIVCIAVPLVILLIIEIINLIRLTISEKKDDSNYNDYEDKVFNQPKKKTNKRDLFADLDKNKTTTIFDVESPIKSHEQPYSKNNVSIEDSSYIPLVLNQDDQSTKTANINTSDYSLDETTEFNIQQSNENKNETINTTSNIVNEDMNDQTLLNRETGYINIDSSKQDNVIKTNDFEDIKTLVENEQEKGVGASKFEANINQSTSDEFNIEGIDVKVKPDALNLNMLEDSSSKNISISVTKEYTNVVIDSSEYELNFALFKDETDNEQKVIIQKKEKTS